MRHTEQPVDDSDNVVQSILGLLRMVSTCTCIVILRLHVCKCMDIHVHVSAFYLHKYNNYM